LKINQKLIIIDLNWLHRFTQKYKLSYRKLTHYSPKSYQEVEGSISEFLREVHQIRATENIIPDMIFNFDEMSVFYDVFPSHSYEKIGVKHPSIKTNNVQKKNLLLTYQSLRLEKS